MTGFLTSVARDFRSGQHELSGRGPRDLRDTLEPDRQSVACVWRITDFPRISNSPHTVLRRNCRRDLKRGKLRPIRREEIENQGRRSMMKSCYSLIRRDKRELAANGQDASDAACPAKAGALEAQEEGL